ncbi:MAG: IS200/IS605 family transposase [Gemmatales bacterium]
MPTFSKLNYHLVFSTKNRRALIEPAWADRLYGYIGGIIAQERGVLLAAGGMPDHIHLLVGFRPDGTLSDLLREIKSHSSAWVHNQFTKDFAWQEGYSAFTVSYSLLESVKYYIKHQEEHHCSRSFMEELLRMLKLNEVDYDERYVFVS